MNKNFLPQKRFRLPIGRPHDAYYNTPKPKNESNTLSYIPYSSSYDEEPQITMINTVISTKRDELHINVRNKTSSIKII